MQVCVRNLHPITYMPTTYTHRLLTNFVTERARTIKESSSLAEELIEKAREAYHIRRQRMRWLAHEALVDVPLSICCNLMVLLCIPRSHSCLRPLSRERGVISHRLQQNSWQR
jgi:hypothetical protein